MASDINRVVLVGRFVRDPELRHTPSGTPVTDFTIASNRTYIVNSERKEEVSFIRCTAWAKGAEIIAEYCKKGHRIGLDGRLRQHSWEDQSGNKRSSIEVVVDNFQFLTPKEGSDGGRSQYQGKNQSDYSGGKNESDYSGASDIAKDNFNDDEIPF